MSAWAEAAHRVILPLHNHADDLEDVSLLLRHALLCPFLALELLLFRSRLFSSLVERCHRPLKGVLLEGALLIHDKVQPVPVGGKNIVLQGRGSEIRVHHMAWRPAGSLKYDMP